jgi:hypothetical protein
MGSGGSKPKKVNNISPFDYYKVGMINVIIFVCRVDRINKNHRVGIGVTQ